MTRKSIKLSVTGFEKGEDDGLIFELEFAPVDPSFQNNLLRRPPDELVSDSWKLDGEQLEKLADLLRAYLTSGECEFFIQERAFDVTQNFVKTHTIMRDISSEQS